MKKAVLSLMACGLATAVLAYPPIYNDANVQVNQWTYKYNEAKAKAAQLGRPIMLAFVNQGNCGFCATWDKNVLSSSDGYWNGFLAANPMILIWVDQGYESRYSSPSWSQLIKGVSWSEIRSYPEIVILSPGGTKIDQFVARSALGSSAGFIGRVSAAIGGGSFEPVDPDPSDPDPVTPDPFPASSVGKYSGVVYEADGRTVSGKMSMTATSSGTLSARIELDGAVYTATARKVTGASDGSFTANLSGRAGTLAVAVDRYGQLTGTFINSTKIVGGLASWTTTDRAAFAGYYTAILAPQRFTHSVQNTFQYRPEGAGYVTFTVSTRGLAKYAGVLADGTKFTGSSDLLVRDGSEVTAAQYPGAVAGISYASFPIYTTLYARRGKVLGQIWINGQSAGRLDDNKVLVAGSEWVYPGQSAGLAGDGFVAAFDNGSVTEVGRFYVQGLNLAQALANKARLFIGDAEGLPFAAYGTSVKLATDNALGASFRVSTRTGVFSGLFKDQSADGRTRQQKYAGVLVPLAPYGGGYYTSYDTVANGYRTKKSGSVVIDPVQ